MGVKVFCGGPKDAHGNELPATPIGTTVGHYRIISKLGAGGMGDVFLAEDTRLERKAAVKFPSVDMASDPERRQRFLPPLKISTLPAQVISEQLDQGTEKAQLQPGGLGCPCCRRLPKRRFHFSQQVHSAGIQEPALSSGACPDLFDRRSGKAWPSRHKRRSRSAGPRKQDGQGEYFNRQCWRTSQLVDDAAPCPGS